MYQQESLNILEFQERFGSDDACRDHLFRIRWSAGLVCPKCGGKVFYKIKSRNIYECSCRHQVSLTAGTIMHRSRTPLTKWFMAIYLVAKDSRGVPALQLMKELNVSYPTAWSMLHKIRRAMGAMENQYQLAGIVEMVAINVGASMEARKRNQNHRTDKTQVQAALSLDDQGNPECVKMEKLDTLAGKSTRDFVVRYIKAGAVIRTDLGSLDAKGMASQPYIHESADLNVRGKTERWERINQVADNAKRIIFGTYHGLGAKHLQAYLDEFCFRFNQRRFPEPIFNLLLNACMLATPITYFEIVSQMEA